MNNSSVGVITVGANAITATSAGAGKVVRPAETGERSVTIGVVAIGTWK